MLSSTTQCFNPKRSSSGKLQAAKRPGKRLDSGADGAAGPDLGVALAGNALAQLAEEGDGGLGAGDQGRLLLRTEVLVFCEERERERGCESRSPVWVIAGHVMRRNPGHSPPGGSVSLNIS